MPCDTPPPPPEPMEDTFDDEDNEYILDDTMYDFIELEELEEEDNTDVLVTFKGHTDAVFCCNFDSTNKYAVTGGQDDTAYVWDVTDGSVKLKCTGHSDSVLAASFNSDSKYVATADMNGLIQVWDMDSLSAVWTFETSEITWLEWLKGENTLIAGSMDGMCWRWDTIPDETTNVFENPGAACTSGCISQNDEKLITGYANGSLKYWDLSNNSLIASLTGGNDHNKAITTIKCNSDSSLILTGFEDGTAKLIKASDFKVLWTINSCDVNTHQHESEFSVEGIGFCKNLPYMVIGTNCGILSVWDGNTKTKRFQKEFNSGIVKIICHELELYVAMDDGTLQTYDIRNGEMIKSWKVHKGAIFDIALARDHSHLLTASDDHNCKIVKL